MPHVVARSTVRVFDPSTLFIRHLMGSRWIEKLLSLQLFVFACFCSYVLLYYYSCEYYTFSSYILAIIQSCLVSQRFLNKGS